MIGAKKVILYLNEINRKMSVKCIMLFLYAKQEKFLEERLRWNYLNDCTSVIVQGKQLKEIKPFSDTIKMLDGTYEEDTRTSEEIIRDTLEMYK